jgi:PIN domain nuclease of toxin-antitoxin system
VSAVLMDSHVLHWWSSQPGRLSRAATRALERADQLLVSSVSWYELAWLAQHERIIVPRPIIAWLEELSQDVLTINSTPAIAVTAATLPTSFPRDPADRVIFATAIEQGCQLVTQDERMRHHPYPRKIAIW